MVELFFWPALVAYGEAAVAYAGTVRGPVLSGRLATWGVRVGWLAQTALLGAQAARADGFPWDTWAGALNLFVWLVVGAYLVWGCQTRYRLLGLGVMPPAALLLGLAGAGGGTGSGRPTHVSTVFLVLHVGLVLAALAGLALGAALSALYLWEERSLKLRRSGLLRLRFPPLATLDELSARTIAVAVPALTFGIAIGLARLHGFDALMAVTLLTWLVYSSFLVLRFAAGWRGRRAALLACAGFALVVAVWVAVPIGHLA